MILISTEEAQTIGTSRIIDLIHLLSHADMNMDALQLACTRYALLSGHEIIVWW